jgi:hypothetical protein
MCVLAVCKTHSYDPFHFVEKGTTCFKQTFYRFALSDGTDKQPRFFCSELDTANVTVKFVIIDKEKHLNTLVGLTRGSYANPFQG